MSSYKFVRALPVRERFYTEKHLACNYIKHVYYVASCYYLTSAADIAMFEEINYSWSFKEGRMFRPSLTLVPSTFLMWKRRIH